MRAIIGTGRIVSVAARSTSITACRISTTDRLGGPVADTAPARARPRHRSRARGASAQCVPRALGGHVRRFTKSIKVRSCRRL